MGFLETAEKKKTIEGTVPGRIIHYTPRGTDGFKSHGEPLVGIIVRVWERSDGEVPLVNIRLFCDGTNQNPGGISEWLTSCQFGADGAAGTWKFTR